MSLIEYLAIDGDNVGLMLERHILDDSIDLLSLASKHLESVVNDLGERMKTAGVHLIFSAGDGVFACGESDRIMLIARSVREMNDPCSFSCGVGETAMHAWVALKRAKIEKPSCWRYSPPALEKVW